MFDAFAWFSHLTQLNFLLIITTKHGDSWTIIKSCKSNSQWQIILHLANSQSLFRLGDYQAVTQTDTCNAYNCQVKSTFKCRRQIQRSCVIVQSLTMTSLIQFVSPFIHPRVSLSRHFQFFSQSSGSIKKPPQFTGLFLGLTRMSMPRNRRLLCTRGRFQWNLLSVLLGTL